LVILICSCVIIGSCDITDYYKKMSQDRAKFKVVLVGDGGSGKTSIINRLVMGKFETNMCTIGASFYIHKIPGKHNELTLELWDT